MKNAKPFVSRAPSNRARQRGASLLEGIAYLGVAALVVLGAVSLLTGAFGSAKSNQTAEEVVALRTVVRKMYTGQAYNADSAMQANLITGKAIPNTLRVVTGTPSTINNTWGGTVAIAATSATAFTITYTLVPQDVCVSVVSGASGWTQISDGASATVTTFPAPATSAAAVCASATNTVVFTAN
ncbi:type 4 pilus major pilin [Pseudoduganella namucuonensis]|uniref:PilS N terminal n=1 Tax=Pseudoduganella namucuonensis TaxID=1035707 RepID=A0A1I7L8C3_9BURK|nr:type 4 pilus major pilin [Pseudoduganella namucuonensis]SFV05786.1 PilS N terminal [Pseudoduganella namucuonensis]